MAKALWYIFGGSWVMSIFLAIYIMTGTNIEPNDLIFNVINTIVQTFQNIGVNIPFWSIIKIMFPIMGVIGTIVFILQIVSHGWRGVGVALSGFFGWLLLLLGGGGAGTYVGLIFILVGFVICSIFEGPPPEDVII